MNPAAAPLVSVVIPAYNARDHLGATLDSALAQDYPALEVIVVDDGSTDDTPALLEGYAGRVTVIRQANAGQAAARNRGAEAARGDLLAFLDSDDLWDPDKTARQVELLARFPEAGATYCDHRVIDTDGRVTGKTGALAHPRPSGDILRALMIGPCIVSPSVVLLRRRAYLEAGRFDERFARGFEDYDLWMRMAVRGPFVYSPDTLVSYRRHPKQTTRQAGYQLRAPIPNLAVLTGVEEAVRARADRALLAYYQDRLFDGRLDAAWTARRLGERAAALRYAWSAWTARPTSVRALRILAGSLLGGASREAPGA